MDEVFGYMPPTANPPSKVLLLTLLKQARAFGVGVVLSTQNPVDLDYKGLSNTGTWFIGRLQTERDKMRVLEGLEGASGGQPFDKQAMERTLAGLGKRRFLLHNVHESGPVVFATRWAMSYLCGPFTRTQIKTLMKDQKAAAAERKPAANSAAKSATRPGVGNATASANTSTDSAPAAPGGIKQYFIRPARPLPEGSAPDYQPMILGVADVTYSNARYHINSERRLVTLADINDGPVTLEWEHSEALETGIDRLQPEPLAGASFAELPAAAANAKNYRDWERLFKRWIRSDLAITLYRSAEFKVLSEPDETEGAFRARLETLHHERRDLKVDKLRASYDKTLTTLQTRLMRAEQKVDTEQAQATQSTMDTVISIGTAIFGAFMGRKAFSVTNTRRIGSAAKQAGRSRKEHSDIERAQQSLAAVQDQIAVLEARLQADIDAIDNGYDSQLEALKEIGIRPKVADIHVHFVGLGWMPM
jgi:hypothetical protein